MSETNSPPQSLSGFHVIEIGNSTSVSYCCKMMADQGATVIKVEDPRFGEINRQDRILPEGGLYDYEHEYTDSRTEYICPTKLTADIQKLINELGLKAFKALKCSCFGRVDFRLSDDNKLYCLEVNTLPGMTSHSLVPKAAKARGISFPQLLEKICWIALEDYNKRKANA